MHNNKLKHTQIRINNNENMANYYCGENKLSVLGIATSQLVRTAHAKNYALGKFLLLAL